MLLLLVCVKAAAQRKTAARVSAADGAGARQERGALGAYIDAVEERHGAAFPPGRTAGLRFMAHLWEPLPALWKPLAVHAGAEAMRAGTCAALRALGFRAARCQVRGRRAALAAKSLRRRRRCAAHALTAAGRAGPAGRAALRGAVQ